MQLMDLRFGYPSLEEPTRQPCRKKIDDTREMFLNVLHSLLVQVIICQVSLEQCLAIELGSQ
jgi:hypothetical protein